MFSPAYAKVTFIVYSLVCSLTGYSTNLPVYEVEDPKITCVVLSPRIMCSTGPRYYVFNYLILLYGDRLIIYGIDKCFYF